MSHKFFQILFITLLLSTQACGQNHKPQMAGEEEKKLRLGVEQTTAYFPLLKDKSIGVVGNHTSLIGTTHLVDSLLAANYKVVKVFSPEHGFRGKADAGEKVEDGIDQKTALPIVSLYGDNKKPSKSQLSGIDVLLFDIQDVGARFYTYISTLHYVMEAAAENNIPVVVLDRPNPNGHYVDGPVLQPQFQSFVGMHPVPIVHGMTIGEYAKMINGEGWLKNEAKCELRVIKCKNYTHDQLYNLQVPPSPNLPNMRSVYLYPSLCLFEGTKVSVGRGTAAPFQQIGHPSLRKFTHEFTPKPTAGAKSPKLNAMKCWGIDFTHKHAEVYRNLGRIDLSYLLRFYENYPQPEQFFISFFNLLAGNDELKQQLKSGKTESEIRESWQEGLTKYKEMREQYLIYE